MGRVKKGKIIKESCPICNGKGYLRDTTLLSCKDIMKDCYRCKGTGEIEIIDKRIISGGK